MSASVAVFVPVEPTRAKALQSGEELSTTGFAATPSLREAHGFGPDEDEEAGYAALGYAGLAALGKTEGLRLVVAADVEPGQVDADSQSTFGAVAVRALCWSQVQALFADEPGALADLGSARTAAARRPLEQIAEDEHLLDLLEPWDLLWYAPQELAGRIDGIT